jgi:hypothetical protein
MEKANGFLPGPSDSGICCSPGAIDKVEITDLSVEGATLQAGLLEASPA